MKTLIKIVFAFSLILYGLSLCSQEIDSKENYINTFQLEATAFVPSYSLVYNLINKSNPTAKPYFGMGVQYFPHSVSHENVYTLYPHIGYIIGKSHNIEFNIGASLDIKNRDFHIPTFIGYRYLAPQKPLSIRAGITFIYLGKSEGESFLDLPMFFPLPTIGIGIAL